MRKALIVRFRRYRPLLWCLVLSLLIHFVIVPLLAALFGVRRPMTQVGEVTYQVSSALRISRVPKPLPRPRRQPQAQPHVQAQAAPPPPRRELAKIDAHAHIAVPHLSQSIDFAQQQRQFEKTIAQLRRQSDPVAGAVQPVATPAAPKRYAFNFRASIGTAPGPHGTLYTQKSWHDGPYTYYYVEYWVEYADGTTETGSVPWPIRFLSDRDPFILTPNDVPLPPPLPDYVLPPDTNLRPFVAFCYEHRSDYSSTCPIAHD